LSALVGFKVPVKAFDQISDFFRQPHQHLTDLFSDFDLFSKTLLQAAKIVQHRNKVGHISRHGDHEAESLYHFRHIAREGPGVRTKNVFTKVFFS
jgi:hypothetical protein